VGVGLGEECALPIPERRTMATEDERALRQIVTG
jgi:hypothetical protein